MFRRSYWRYSIQKVLLKFRKIHRKTLVLDSIFIKLQDWGLQLIKKRLWHRCFLVKFAKLVKIFYLLLRATACECYEGLHETFLFLCLFLVFVVVQIGPNSAKYFVFMWFVLFVLCSFLLIFLSLAFRLLHKISISMYFILAQEKRQPSPTDTLC